MILFCVKLFHFWENNGKLGIEAQSGKRSLRYDCVTADRAAMEALVGLCNENNLEICHLGDVLEDFLTDFCI